MRFEIRDSDSPRFEGEFTIGPAAGYSPAPAEQSYLDALARVLTILARDEEYDRRQPNADTSPVIIANRRVRKAATDKLRSRAEDFVRLRAAAAAPDDALAILAADDALAIRALYTRELARIVSSLFVVEEVFELDPGTSVQQAVDVRIQVANDLPPPNNVPSPEKQALFVAVNNASTVIRTVCQRMRDRSERFLPKAPFNQFWRLRAKRLLDQYMRKLANIARVGLQESHTALANLALESLRQEFVAQEAGRIKNDYVRSLGFSALIAVLVLFGIYALIEIGCIKSPFWVGHKAFLIAMAGSAIGAWLSFSIRRVTLSFDDLITLEEDRLDLSLRIIFIIGLTMTACLLFWTGAMNIEIGMLKTAQFAGSKAFLIGLFAGLAERALATAISGRAASFVRGVAGGG